MRYHLLSDSPTLYAEGKPPESLMNIIHAFWFLAGGAMLLFTIFLAVLIVAGIVFRAGPRALGRKPAVVFGISTALVAVVAGALLSPIPSRDSQRLVGSYAAAAPNASPPSGGVATGAGLPRATARSLVLYESATPDPKTEELYATMLVNLVSHFGDWTAQPVEAYRSGQMSGYDAVFYLGEPGGAAVPSAFLDDVARDKRRVMWINGDIEQLQARGAISAHPAFGFSTPSAQSGQVTRLEYKGASLPVESGGPTAYTLIGVDDPTQATVLATAQLADGGKVPWAVRSGKLTYISENPLVSQGNLEGRNTVFSDLLFAVLDPNARSRHRALVRLEDVNPTTEPADIRAIADYLSGQKVPFSIGLYPVFRDPSDTSTSPDGVTIRLSERPELVEALRYALARGGSLVLHGYTHQYGTKKNPYNGASGDDTEFYLCHLDETQSMRLDGPVPEDSEAWVLGRVDAALAELRASGLPKPSTWEFSHYLASALDYRTVGKRFDSRFERTLYYPGILSGQPVDDTAPFGQLLPYAVRDVYGTTVIPENLGYVESGGESIPGMLEAARNGLVVRDGVASFFYHPFLGVGQLPRLVDGLRDLGYTFTSAQSLASS